MPRIFGIIAHEVLDRGADALALHSFDVCDCDSRGEVGIFAEVFEIPAVQRGAINVHAWAEEEIYALGSGIAPNLFANLAGEGCVPGSREVDSCCHRRSGTEIPDAHRPVGHL